MFYLSHIPHKSERGKSPCATSPRCWKETHLSLGAYCVAWDYSYSPLAAAKSLRSPPHRRSRPWKWLPSQTPVLPPRPRQQHHFLPSHPPPLQPPVQLLPPLLPL